MRQNWFHTCSNKFMTPRILLSKVKVPLHAANALNGFDKKKLHSSVISKLERRKKAGTGDGYCNKYGNLYIFE